MLITLYFAFLVYLSYLCDFKGVQVGYIVPHPCPYIYPTLAPIFLFLKFYLLTMYCLYHYFLLFNARMFVHCACVSTQKKLFPLPN
jgi:hypothetical protein